MHEFTFFGKSSIETMLPILKKIRHQIFGLTKEEAELAAFINPELRQVIHINRVNAFHAWIRWRLQCADMTVEKKSKVYHLLSLWLKCYQGEAILSAYKAIIRSNEKFNKR